MAEAHWVDQFTSSLCGENCHLFRLVGKWTNKRWIHKRCRYFIKLENNRANLLQLKGQRSSLRGALGESDKEPQRNSQFIGYYDNKTKREVQSDRWDLPWKRLSTNVELISDPENRVCTLFPHGFPVTLEPHSGSRSGQIITHTYSKE